MLKVRERIINLLREIDEEIIDTKAIESIKNEIHGLYLYFDLEINSIKQLTHSLLELIWRSELSLNPFQKEILKQAFFSFLSENEIDAEYFEKAFEIIESKLGSNDT